MPAMVCHSAQQSACHGELRGTVYDPRASVCGGTHQHLLCLQGPLSLLDPDLRQMVQHMIQLNPGERVRLLQ